MIKRKQINIDQFYKPIEIFSPDGTLHKLRYYVEDNSVYVAGTPKKAALQKGSDGRVLDPEGLARMLAREWLKEQAARAKPVRR